MSNSNEDIFKLKQYEVNVLIDFFMYHMDMDLRRKLMSEFPEIYNKVCKKVIVKSKKVSD